MLGEATDEGEARRRPCTLRAPTALQELIAAAGVGLALDEELGLGLALAGFGLMLAWWRLRLPPP